MQRKVDHVFMIFETPGPLPERLHDEARAVIYSLIDSTPGDDFSKCEVGLEVTALGADTDMEYLTQRMFAWAEKKGFPLDNHKITRTTLHTGGNARFKRLQVAYSTRK